MPSEKFNNLIIGALLHDIGKVVHRSGNDGRNHSQSGFAFLKEDCSITNEQILNCVKYHHKWKLKNADLPKDDPAYIIYIADNIASGIDRRERGADDEKYDEAPFSKDAKFESIFNLLYGRKETYFYEPCMLAESERGSKPVKNPSPYDDNFYKKVLRAIRENVREMKFSSDYIDSLSEILEGNLSYIPSTTARKQVRDISLYDHAKITAAISGCIYYYLTSIINHESRVDFKKILFEEESDFYNQTAFLLYSLDMSGIQNFIYTIRSEGALKSLRGRSFYLEILMEHLADTLLSSLGLPRANLLYSGGGHLYMLLPNTEETKRKIAEFESGANDWLTEQYRSKLFVAGGYEKASSDSLRNEPQGSYSALYRQVSEIISEKKLKRYSKEELLRLNNMHDEGRECRICKTVSPAVSQDKDCELCESLKLLSKDVQDSRFFVIKKGKSSERANLPFGFFIEPLRDEKKVREIIEDDCDYARVYGKNSYFQGKGVKTKLWTGDYYFEKELGKYAVRDKGIRRLGVLRMDVDNLGSAFVSGFAGDSGKYNTISRTSSFSRQLSMFFKRDLNDILKNKKCTIIYAGGDDVFIIGAWDDIIESALDIRREFTDFSQNKLTLSAGIGMFGAKYPVHAMARETGELEDYSKENIKPLKDSITLFDKSGRYGWDEFIADVRGEKYKEVKSYFDMTGDRGFSFLYNLLVLIDGRLKDKKKGISFARWAYFLARIEPDIKDEKEWLIFKAFAEKLKKWFDDGEQVRKLDMALRLYVYENRKNQDKEFCL